MTDVLIQETRKRLSPWLSEKRCSWIGGQWVESPRTFSTINPATEAVLSEVCEASEREVAQAIAAARAAFQKGDWARRSLAERASVLRWIADQIDAHRMELAVLESMDAGKPISESYDGDVARAAYNFRFFADFATDHPEVFEQKDATHQAFREPLGVVVLITPWNLPLYLETWKLAPALLMGNSCVLKPSELTPLTASYLAGLLSKSELPKGVFQLVHGLGEKSAGEFLTASTGIDGISFTGETSTGRAIMKAAAAGPTRVSFELGGKGALVVFEDAEMEAALNTALRAGFRNQGEICLACPRIYVHESHHAQFVERFAERASQIRVGDPLSMNTQMGALVSQEHLKKVISYVEKARGSGKVVTGGVRPTGLEKGFFLSPTVITGLAEGHPAIQEEIFGPVVCIQSFRDEAEVIANVNGTPYGLSSSIWTQDPAKANRVAKEIRTGLVWVNCWFVRDLRVPFGGMKRSGVGREGGTHSLDFYSEWKSVCTAKEST